MKILHIIGNGFDINLGMKTRYVDFYKFYKSAGSRSEKIANLKNDISKNFKNWSDLELSLGSYTENLSTIDEFDEVYEDIGEKLAHYLEHQEKQFNSENLDVEKFYNFLAYPELSLLKADEDKLVTYKNNWREHYWYLDIITLNYTRTIEKIVGDNSNNIVIGKHHNNAPIQFKGIEHLHGYVNDRMIMGVNDLTQVKNVKFHKNQDILDALIKLNCNKAHKHTIDDLCADNIKSANLICIFGSSIGDTDNYWWELIGDQLKRKDCQLIVFDVCDDINPRIAHKKARKERETKSRFLNKTKLTEEEKKNFEEKIYIGINTNFFKSLDKSNISSVANSGFEQVGV
jgi:abortive infection AbiH-like protein